MAVVDAWRAEKGIDGDYVASREALELWLGQSRWRAAQWRCNDAGQGLPEPYRQTVCFAEAA